MARGVVKLEVFEQVVDFVAVQFPQTYILDGFFGNRKACFFEA